MIDLLNHQNKEEKDRIIKIQKSNENNQFIGLKWGIKNYHEDFLYLTNIYFIIN